MNKFLHVIDDDASVRYGLSRLLLAAGYDVKAFACMGDFIDDLDSEMLGCIILDLRMPDMTEERFAELKARNTSLPIIVVTADDNSESKRKAQNMKAIGFFRKPVDGTALIDAIEWAFRSSYKENNYKNNIADQ